MPFLEWMGRVVKVDQEPLTQVPELLSGDHRLPRSGSTSAADRPEETSYRITVVVDEPDFAFPHQAIAGLRVAGRPKTVFERALKYLRKTFRADILF